MSRIFGSNSTPGDWMVSPFVEDDSEKISKADSAIDEADIVEARNEIERCKASGEKFYYSENTPEGVKSQLREYAEAIGMKDIEGVSQERVERSRISESLKNVEKEGDSAEVEMVFDIMPTVATDQEAFSKDDSWKKAENSRAKTLGEKPSGEGIASIRGGETYENDPVKKVKPGQNSIDDPDAIETLASSEDKSTVDEIRAQNEKKRSETVFDRDDWQQQKEVEMSENTIVPQAGNKIVESPNLQNHSWQNPGSMSIDGGLNEMPDRTQGETISELNDVRRAGISRETEEDDWERMESSVAEKVSDIFIENLEKNLDKLK